MYRHSLQLEVITALEHTHTHSSHECIHKCLQLYPLLTEWWILLKGCKRVLTLFCTLTCTAHRCKGFQGRSYQYRAKLEWIWEELEHAQCSLPAPRSITLHSHVINWGWDSVAKLLSILITDIAIHFSLLSGRGWDTASDKSEQLSEWICNSVESRI